MRHKKAPKGYIHKAIRKGPTVRAFLWALFEKGYVPRKANVEKLAAVSEAKIQKLRDLHPEYRLSYGSVRWQYCIWKKTLPENQKVWRKM